MQIFKLVYIYIYFSQAYAIFNCRKYSKFYKILTVIYNAFKDADLFIILYVIARFIFIILQNCDTINIISLSAFRYILELYLFARRAAHVFSRSRLANLNVNCIDFIAHIH